MRVEPGRTPILIGDGCSADLATLIDSRLLIQANSGGGKSYCVRRLLEQTHGQVQQLIIDPEGEFVSLREKFDYVLAAKGGDTPADPRTAALLTERLLELQASAILDIYELKHHDRIRFVKIVLDALVNAPKKLWHPVMVVLDEAHVFCLDEETELLTTKGWRKHSVVDTETMAVTFDVASGSYGQELVERVIRKHHSGPMVRFVSDGIDCLATPDHRVVLRREQRAKGRQQLYDWTFCKAADVRQQIRVPTGGAPYGDGVPVPDDILRVMGWVITDGSWHHGEASRALSICQAITTVKAGANMVDVMDSVLMPLGCKGRYERSRRPSNRTDGRVVGHSDSIQYYLGTALSEPILEWLRPDIHRIPRRIIEGATAQQLHVLMRALLDGDGSATDRHFYPGHNEGLADDFQELATRLGISTVKKWVTQTKQWTILISHRKHHYIRKPVPAQYDGIVWCITVPSGAFVARRRGKVFVTGNCPQRGEAESLGSVIDLCSRGRKRGFAAILATQRLSKLHKDAAAECNNKLIGRSSLDVDMKRAAEELGFSSRDQQMSLRQLEPGEFYAYGPAVSREVVKIKVGPIQTTHPKPGARIAFTAPPPTAKVREILSRLADLPAEVEERERSIVEMRQEIRELRKQVAARPIPPVLAPQRLNVPVLKDGQVARVEAILRRADQVGDVLETRIRRVLRDIGLPLEAIREALQQVASAAAHVAGPSPVVNKPAAAHQTTPARNGHGQPFEVVALSPGLTKVLMAVAPHGEGVTRQQLTVLSGYARSTRDLYVQRLESKGLIESFNGLVRVTPAGIAQLGNAYVPLPASGPELREFWLRKLPPGEAKLLRMLLSYPREPNNSSAIISRDRVGESTGFKRSTRDLYLSRLVSRNLVIAHRDGVSASHALF